MTVIYVLIPLSLLIAGGFLAAFWWAVRSGQYEDTATPSMRVLMEDDQPLQANKPSKQISKPTKTKP